ncbi:translation initiation factor eIF 4e-like domain-containing protein [Entophlyctis helioformis]|nr:translation initiation factor eIF 4e-like domain-containing protein [Entophlyctis helioformis]
MTRRESPTKSAAAAGPASTDPASATTAAAAAATSANGGGSTSPSKTAAVAPLGDGVVADGPKVNEMQEAHQKLVVGSGLHKLHYSWDFWFMHRAPGAKIQDYTSEVKHLCTMHTVEDFWGAYSHLKWPNELTNISDYHVFKEGIRPTWEDNLVGGKWIIRLKKGIASRYWEDLLLAIMGDQFDVGDEICGAVISIRHSEDILSLWNKTADDGRTNLRIRDTMKRVLSLPPNCVLEYKAHKAAVADNSSFRNTETYR